MSGIDKLECQGISADSRTLTEIYHVAMGIEQMVERVRCYGGVDHSFEYVLLSLFLRRCILKSLMKSPSFPF
jgi:hypothetical protein